MGLDLGEKRIGIAVTDASETMAFPERVLQRRSARRDRQTLALLVDELAVERVIIGLPLSMDGDFGPNAQRTRRFGELLAHDVRVPIEYQDERLTTVEAEERLRDSGLAARKRRQRIDAAAAAIILEDYLRARRR